MRIRFIACLLSVMACFAFLSAAAQAQSNLPTATLAALKATPNVILDAYPAGGVGMVSFVSRILTSDIGLLDDIIKLLESANVNQRAAIGAGLAQATKFFNDLAEKAVDDASKQSAVESAELIAKSVAESQNPTLLASYRVALGRAPAATGGGGSGGGAPGGGASGGSVGTSASGAGSSNSGGTVITTNSGSFLDSGGGASFTGTGGVLSVSPTT